MLNGVKFARSNFFFLFYSYQLFKRNMNGSSFWFQRKTWTGKPNSSSKKSTNYWYLPISPLTMTTRWSGSAPEETWKTSSPPLSASTLMTALLSLPLKQPPPIFLNTSMLLPELLAATAKGLQVGDENPNPMLNKNADSLRIGLENADASGDDDEDEAAAEAVRRGEVAAIMERIMWKRKRNVKKGNGSFVCVCVKEGRAESVTSRKVLFAYGEIIYTVFSFYSEKK